MYEHLAVALYGEQTIPEQWRTQVVQHGLIPSCAEQLYTLAVKLGQADAACRDVSKRNERWCAAASIPIRNKQSTTSLNCTLKQATYVCRLHELFSPYW